MDDLFGEVPGEQVSAYRLIVHLLLCPEYAKRGKCVVGIRDPSVEVADCAERQEGTGAPI